MMHSTLIITLPLSIRRGGNNVTCHLAYRVSTKLALVSWLVDWVHKLWGMRSREYSAR